MINSIQEEYCKHGFVKFNLLTKEQVGLLRDEILENSQVGASKELYLDYFLNDFKGLNFFTINGLTNALDDLFTQYYFLPDLNIQINRIDVAGRKSGWHIDCGTEYSLGRDYLFSDRYKFLKVGIYLQDNTMEYGGGIDIQPRSHKLFYIFRNKKLNRILLTIRDLVVNFIPSKRVRIQAGDAILFDSRLVHRSSPSKVAIKNFSKENSKIAIYWTVAGSEYLAKCYNSAMIGRAFDVSSGENAMVFYQKQFSINFPDDFQSKGIEEFLDRKINFITFQKEITNYFKKELQHDD